jgi:myo-inositol-1(or 4)-monophosphatase
MISGRFYTSSPTLNLMIAAATKAAQGLVRDFGDVAHLQVSRKGIGDFVSAADQRSEMILIQELSRTYPDYNFLTEESGWIDRSDAPFCWIIDPLDGTLNFLHSIPHFCISIALQKYDEIIIALVYDPIKDEVFWAEKGRGSFLNRRRLRVSDRKNIDEALVVSGSPFAGHGRDRSQVKTILEDIGKTVAGCHSTGSTALDLAYLAAGRYDAFVNNHVCAWDMASGILLIQESGGIVQDWKGGSDMLASGTLFASNPHFSQTLFSAIQRSEPIMDQAQDNSDI